MRINHIVIMLRAFGFQIDLQRFLGDQTVLLVKGFFQSILDYTI